MIARAAQLLHAGLDLEERVARLLLRLELGIPGPIVDLARYDAVNAITLRLIAD